MGEQPENQPEEQPAKKGRGPGRPFVKGESGNPSGLPSERKWEERLAETERRWQEREAEKDRRIAELEEKLADRGLREENKVLKVRVKDLEAEVERLGKENAELRGAHAPDADADPGADEIDGQIERMLLEAKDEGKKG